jgi:hypothetical protein
MPYGFRMQSKIKKLRTFRMNAWGEIVIRSETDSH